MTIGMCFGLVVLAPRGDVSGSSKTSVGVDGLRSLLDSVEGLSSSSKAVRERLFEASAFADNDFWCFFAGFQDLFGDCCCCFFGVAGVFFGELLPDETLPGSF